MNDTAQVELSRYSWVVGWVAALMLFIAVPEDIWPYGYYSILRWTILFACGYYGYLFTETEKTQWIIAFWVIGILFNPIVPFYLQKETWVPIDIAAGVTFLTAQYAFRKIVKVKINWKQHFIGILLFFAILITVALGVVIVEAELQSTAGAIIMGLWILFILTRKY